MIAEGRIRTLEDKLREALRAIDQLNARAANNSNQVIMSGGGGSTGSGGGGTTVFMIPAGIVIAGGGSVTTNVFKLVGGVITTIATGVVVYNPYTVATTAGKALTLGSNGDGSFAVIGQSC